MPWFYSVILNCELSKKFGRVPSPDQRDLSARLESLVLCHALPDAGQPANLLPIGKSRHQP